MDDKIIKYMPNREEYSSVKGTNLGLIVDTETTGVDDSDEIIEITILPFLFDDELKIGKVHKALTQFQDTNKFINEEATRVHGITKEMIAGKEIDDDKVIKLFDKAEVVIAHRAEFDRYHIEKRFRVPQKLWACSMHDIDWKKQMVNSRALDYLAFRYGFWFDNHRSENDSRATLEILASMNLNNERTNFEELMLTAYETTTMVYAYDSPFDTKDELKKRGYRWNPDKKVWYKENVQDTDVERQYLYSLSSKINPKFVESDVLLRYTRK